MHTASSSPPLTPARIGAVLAALPAACPDAGTLAERVRCELRALCAADGVASDLVRDYLRLRVLWPMVHEEPARARAAAERIADALRETRVPAAGDEQAEARICEHAGLTLLGRVTEEEMDALDACRDALLLRFG